MSCACCDPDDFERRIRDMLKVIRRIPGTQSTWEQIRRADDDWAYVGRKASDLLTDLFKILVDEMVNEDQVAEAIYESEPGVKNWVDWKEIVNDPANAELLKKYQNYARAAIWRGIQ